MKTLLSILVLLVSSCVMRPIVKDTNEGAIVIMGGTFAARAKNVMASVETRSGTKIKYYSEEENSEDVPKLGILAAGSVAIAGSQAGVDKVNAQEQTKQVISGHKLEAIKASETTKQLGLTETTKQLLTK